MNPSYHTVTGTALPDDRSFIGPLLGNDELKLLLDARGCMHDYEPRPSWAPPRIVWAGRRHNQRIDRYNSNQFEYGFLDIRRADEDRLPPMTGWRQQLDPTGGVVETVIERAGGLREHAVTFLCLDRNLLVFRRTYTGFPATTVRANYVFCQVDAATIPFRATWTPLPATTDGIAANFTADGHRVYQGRIELFADRAGTARALANRLELDVAASGDDAVTFYLALEDDLGDDPQLMTVFEGDWMPAGVRAVQRENDAAAKVRQAPDPVAAVAATRRHVTATGFAGLLAAQQAAWRAYTQQYRLRLPAHEEKLAAAVRGAIYHVRCGYSRYSWGSSPFNSSWGAHYAWNERYPVEGLLAWGVTDMPRRVMEWRRRILPFLSMRASARGAFYHHSSVEPGTSTGERCGTNFFELFLPGLIAHYLDLHYRYEGDPALRRRYYPVIRECAEFMRHWLLIELPGNNLMTAPLIDVDEGIYPVQDGPFTISSAARAFDLAARYAEQLGEDADLLPVWRRYRDLSILLVRHTGRNKSGGSGDFSAIYYDLELETVPQPDLVVDTAIRDWRDAYKAKQAGVNQFKKYGQNVSGDFSKPPNWPWGAFQQAYLQATLERPDHAMAALARGLRVLLPFGGQCESATEDLSRVDHPWFTTASGALLRAMARILLRPQDDQLWLLPGVPASWTELAFALPAHGRVWVDVEVAGGRLTRATFTGPADTPRTLTVHVPARFLPAETSINPLASLVNRTATTATVRVPVRGRMNLIGKTSHE